MNYYNCRALSDEQIEWAWKKYCEGYTRQQIADALYVCRRTLDRYFKGKKRVRPKLVYEESEQVWQRKNWIN